MPLVVNLDTGETRTFDLEAEESAIEWARLKASSPGSIRAVSVKTDRTLHALTRPREGFSSLRWDGELVYHRNGSGRIIGERATLYVDGMTMSILAYRSRRPQMVKYTLEKSGAPVFQPVPPEE